MEGRSRWHPLILGRTHDSIICLFIYLLCQLYPRVPHQFAALFSLGPLHYIHDKTNINRYTFSSNTVITWYMYMLTTYTCFSLNITMVTWSWYRFIQMLTTYNDLIHVWSTYNYLPNVNILHSLHNKLLKCSLVSRLTYAYSLIDFKCSGKLLKYVLPVYPIYFWLCTVLSAGIFTLPEVDVRVLCL